MASFTRQDIERREEQTLAPYAALSKESRGRVYPQQKHGLRTEYQRDRDRIIHSTAFRRLEYKTQVFIPHEKDHFRTRLTHSIEVAQISRTIARSLCLNEDLVEAIALVHDLGHTPFGHSGEKVLDELLSGLGGFNHNRQSLRVVDLLEHRYPDFPGLNLTYEVREGIVKHETKVKLSLPGFDFDESPTLEAVLVDLADEIAYNSHDIDDGLSSGLLSIDQLKEQSLLSHFDPGAHSSDPISFGRHAVVRRLVDVMATDVVEETGRRIRENSIDSVSAVRLSGRRLCSYSDETGQQVLELKQFLSDKLYAHPTLRQKSEEADRIIRSLFENLLASHDKLPPRYRQRIPDEPAEIVVADYIAGMTDRFALQMHAELEA